MRLFHALVLLAVLSAGCGRATPTPDLSIQLTRAVQTAFAAIRQTQTAIVHPATGTPTVAATAANQTPPDLAPTFTTKLLNPADTPHTYIQDSCEYLKEKWSSKNSPPGTVAMVIMIHGITKGAPDAGRPQDISGQDFNQMMNDLHDQGFQSIYMQELQDFLYTNAKIPLRSVVLIQDDRHSEQDAMDWFYPYYQKWGWPFIRAFISSPTNDNAPYTSTTGNLWKDQEDLAAQGWLDLEAHGVQHFDINSTSSESYIMGELQGSWDAFQQHFNKTPIAFIWPGGGFTQQAIALARQVGYKLGFTVNPRGPLMYNWIPLADQPDAARPSYLAEGPVNDPLMVLPRYWDTDARSHIDTVRQIGDAAAAYAQQQKPNEIAYYNLVCAPNYGPLP